MPRRGAEDAGDSSFARPMIAGRGLAGPLECVLVSGDGQEIVRGYDDEHRPDDGHRRGGAASRPARAAEEGRGRPAPAGTGRPGDGRGPEGPVRRADPPPTDGAEVRRLARRPAHAGGRGLGALGRIPPLRRGQRLGRSPLDRPRRPGRAGLGRGCLRRLFPVASGPLRPRLLPARRPRGRQAGRAAGPVRQTVESDLVARDDLGRHGHGAAAVLDRGGPEHRRAAAVAGQLVGRHPVPGRPLPGPLGVGPQEIRALCRPRSSSPTSCSTGRSTRRSTRSAWTGSG